MKKEQFNIAKKLEIEEREIKRELDVWETNLKGKNNLAYGKHWDSDCCIKLDTKIPDNIFEGFRISAMNSLKLRLTDIEKEFKNL